MSIPSNNSHALQPLDVRVFNGVKDVFYKHVLDFYRDSGNATIDKDSFPPLLRHVWDGMKRTWIVHGFEKTGIYPYNRHAVDDKIVLNPKTLDPASLYPNKKPKHCRQSDTKLLIRKLA